ncbi:unnamed protein product [Brachionus calyciflorus]|uniref:Uncharacterized protein n=1 Tax=Brachionus calyciflorus TaxID=104777 RepID=A0A814NCI3_9BILA|nr:unnamed protein product [Brachionus calyciflorus]
MSFEVEIIKDKILSKSEVTLAEDFCELCQPLKDLTEILSSRNYVSVSMIFPAIYTLIFHELDQIQLRTVQISNLRDELIKSLRGRFSHIFNDNFYVAATFLSFKYRNLSFIKDECSKEVYLNKAKNYVIKLNGKLNEKLENSQSISSTQQSNISVTQRCSSDTQDNTPLVKVSKQGRRLFNKRNK